jgi:hypothetical protein
MNDTARNVFGAMAFIVSAVVIGLVLSPYVPAGKEGIANLILGNVLSWPMIVISFFYGSSTGSKEKTAAMAANNTLDLTGSEQDQ